MAGLHSTVLNSHSAILNSVVVPAYHEKANIRPLTERLFKSIPNSTANSTELIIVDDNSNDGSVEVVDQLKKEGYNIRIIVRTEERGLSSAVLTGFSESNGVNLVCMDADLQHPPETVQAFFEKLNDYDFVLGTRYGKGVEMDKNWPMYRRIISTGARYLARPLSSASDPMTGFFGVRKAVFQKATNLNRQGFKIALDLLVKSKVSNKKVGEVPYSFGVRTIGESKLSSKIIIYYVFQLLELYLFKFGLLPCLFSILFIILAGAFTLEYLLDGSIPFLIPRKTVSKLGKKIKLASKKH